MPQSNDSTSATDPGLDEALQETFPASDPPANTVETGIRTGESAPSPLDSVTDNRETQRLELVVDGHTAFLVYERTPETLTVIHTEVPGPVRGRHFGEALVTAAVRSARSERLRLIVVCPFARTFLQKHPELK